MEDNSTALQAEEMEPMAPAAEEAVIEEASPAKPSSGSTYSKEHKLKRYYSCLRDFMAHFHQRSEAYPLDHEFTDDELSAVEPNDIVNWMNVKMFGTLIPDFSGGSTMSGSHHTLAFYRKGIGYFMPSGTKDWDSLTKKGNPTRSHEVRDLIARVKELNDDGIATPRPRPKGKKRDAEEGEETQKRAPKSKKKTKKELSNPEPFTVSEEVSGLLRHIHTQKTKFMRRLDDMSSAVEKMKKDVEVSYDIMVTQVSNIGSRVSTASQRSASMNPHAPAPLQALPRSRNLFTVWTVQNGKLTPLAADWTFPSKLSIMDALNLWVLGEPSSHTPPLQYLTVGHMKHIKGAAENYNRLRRFMKTVKYLGVKAGYWCENWDSDRIAALWDKIWPIMEEHLGTMSSEAKAGESNLRTLINGLTKQGGVAQEIAENPTFLDEVQVGIVATATEEALKNAGGGSDGMGDGTPSTRSLELLWGVHHGKLNPLPADWEFPIASSIIEALHLWLLGDDENNIPPFKYIHSSYVVFVKSGSGYLSKLRCVMKVIIHFGIKLNCWFEYWDAEKINNLWYTVWDYNVERIKFKRTDGRAGAVTWQSVYNRMHESGLIKEVSADSKDEDADQDQQIIVEVGVGPEKETIKEEDASHQVMTQV